MPSRNIVKLYGDDQYYHVYNRGVNKDDIFRDDSDYAVLLSLLKRHLSNEIAHDKFGREFKHLKNDVALLAYCLMPNHYHLLLLNRNKTGVEQLMRSIGTAYSRYFNKKYGRVGPVFQGNFKASLIYSDSYIQHISRYIHLNPENYKNYRWSSYIAITQRQSVEWLDSNELLQTFNGTIKDYVDFVDDYIDYKDMLDEIKYDLADQ